MKDAEWFKTYCAGAFPHGAWYYELGYQPDEICDERKVRKQIDAFADNVRSYLNTPATRFRPRVVTRTKKWSRDGKIHYTHFLLCSKRDDRSRMVISEAWKKITGGTASGRILYTQAEALNRAHSIAYYFLPKEEGIVKLIERQYLTVDAVRALCIHNNWYTRGDNADYDNMFRMVRELGNHPIITADGLYPIAADICKHSDIEYDVTDVMYALGEIIVRTYGFEEGGTEDE